MINKNMFFKIIDSAERLVSCLCLGRQDDGKKERDDAFVQLILGFWQEFVDCLDALSLPFKKRENISYAMSAFVDETILLSGWPCKDLWSRRPLQLRFFGEQVAGEGFYQRLDDCLKDVRNNLWVITFYGWLLQLGFKGKYITLNDKKRRFFIEKAKEATRLLLISKPKGERKKSIRPGLSGGFLIKHGVIPYAAVCVIFLFFSYVYLWASVKKYSENIYLPEIQKSSEQINKILSKDL